jgi:MEMO1 family protein
MIREPAVAGQFYPANRLALEREVRSFLGVSDGSLDATAVIAPHAGYMYSGSVAGSVYGAIKPPTRGIILGPNHTGFGTALSLYPDGEWKTPLGRVPIDPDLNARLRSACPQLSIDSAAHTGEHSLEVQVPFLQLMNPGFRFSAVCVGTADFKSLEELGHAVAQVVRSSLEKVLIVCSSDMNHFEPAEVGRKKDRLAIDRLLALDPSGLYQVVIENDISMCGFAPAVAVLTACKDLGASAARLIRYSNSGDVNGDYRRVVGYAGVVILDAESAAGTTAPRP